MKLIPILIGVLTSFAAYAQDRPEWLNEQYRESQYSNEEYYTGFAQDRLEKGESISACLDRIKANATNRLSESIILFVTGKTDVINKSYQVISNKGTDESVYQDYKQQLTSATQSVLVNHEVKTFFDQGNSQGYAFAYIKKNSLESYYSNRIVSLLERARSEQNVSMAFEESGKMSSAKGKLTVALGYLEDTQPFFLLLAAVASDNRILDKHSEVLSLYESINQSLSRMDKGPSVFITGTYVKKGDENDAFIVDPGILKSVITQALSNEKLQIVDEESNADFVLELNTSTSLRSKPVNGRGLLSYYANAEGRLINQHTGKEVTTFYINRDAASYATGVSPEQAGIRAFSSNALKQTIVTLIINSITL